MEMTPEQQALQEKLKNMSPEELKEFQMQQCIFCQMITGKVQVKKVYEDNITFAILDINPANPGHILLLPKEHYAIMPQIPEEELAHIFMVAKELSHALLRALGVEGTNIFIANGVAAGQRAQHFMVHIIPRMDGDNVGLDIPKKEMDDTQMEQVRQLLAASISKATGIEEPKQAVEEKRETIGIEKEESEPEKKEEEPVKEHEPESEKETIVEDKEDNIEDKEEGGQEEHKNSLDMISDLLSNKTK